MELEEVIVLELELEEELEEETVQQMVQGHQLWL